MVTSGVSPCVCHEAHAAVNIQLAWELNEPPNTPWTGNLLQDVAARGMYIAADAKPSGRSIHNVYVKLQWHSMHDHPLWIIFLQLAFVAPTQSTQNVFGMQPCSVEAEEFRTSIQQAPRPKSSADVSTWLGTRCILCFEYTLSVTVKSDQCRMAHRGGAAPTTWSREHLQGDVPTPFAEVGGPTTATGMPVPHPVQCMLQPSFAGTKVLHR